MSERSKCEWNGKFRDERSIAVREYKSGRRAWKDGFNDTEREKVQEMKALQMEVLVQEFD